MLPEEIYSGTSLSLDHGIAENLGADAALLFNHIVYWLRVNAEKPNCKLVDDKYWMYETQKQMSEFFGFLSEDQIGRALKKLVDSGLIIHKNMSKNPFDRTYSYTVFNQQLIKKSLRNRKFAESTPQNRGLDTLKTAESESANLRNVYISLEEQEEKQQQQRACAREASKDSPSPIAAAAAFSNSSLKEEYPEFAILGITEASLSLAVGRYTSNQIKRAMAWLKAKKDKVNKTPDQAFLWACKEQPEIELTKEEKQQQQLKRQDDLEDLIAQRRHFARRIESYCFNYMKEKGLDVLERPLTSCDGTYIEFRGRIAAKILYKDQSFKNLLESHMRKVGFPIPDFFKELK